jgi:hypothetical protein
MSVHMVWLILAKVQNCSLICATHFKRNVSSGVVGNHLSNLPDIAVTVLALVRAETPVRHHGGKAGQGGVLGCDFLGPRTSKEVEVKNTTQSVVLKILALRVVDLDVHTLGAGQEDTVGAVLAAVVKVDGVSSVKVGAFWGTVGITVPELIQLAGILES